MGQHITFDWFKKGIKAAIHNVKFGRWNKGHIKAYLEVVGLNDWIIERV